MAEVDNVGEIFDVGDVVAHGILYAAVQVDCQHALGACRHASGTEGVAELVVGNLVAQTAARGERVGVVAQIGEEGMPFGIHLGCKVCPFAVAALTVFSQQCHGLHGEGEQGLGTLFVEPFHEPFLQPRQTVPVGFAPIGENKVAEKAVEIVAVVVGDVPKHRLVVAGTCGLVQRVYYLLKAVGNHLVDGALFDGEVYNPVGFFPVLPAVFQPEEIVQIHQELGCGAGTAQHAGDHKDHIDKATAEALQVGRSLGVAADGSRAPD